MTSTSRPPRGDLRAALAFASLLLVACGAGAGGDASRAGGGAGDASADDAGGTDGRLDSGAGVEAAVVDGAGPPCPLDPCEVIAELPYQSSGDTAASPLDSYDSYSCAPLVGEAGPELVYQLHLAGAGTLVAMLDDGQQGADVDVHLLSALDPSACLARGHVGLSMNLTAGTYYLVVDSWSDSGGVALPGPFTLYVRFLRAGTNCAMEGGAIERIGASAPLAMPATGQVVKEAHLVTDQELTDGSWPQSITDGIDQHYALSEAETGFAMDRTEPWAPCCEPSNAYGQGSSVRPPVGAEAFYINMRWSSAPPLGQRYIVFDGRSGRAVVGAAGYENGPGDTTRIGGACEEIHQHLGTGHLSVITLGVAADQELGYGPIICEE